MAAIIKIDLRELAGFQQKLDRLMDFDRAELLEGIGGLIENQTRARLEGGGPAPDGSLWPRWSPRYALTRQGGNNKYLIRDSHLIDSIQSKLSGDSELLIGSNMEYARIHNEGGEAKPGVKIPKRQFLGLSDENQTDIEAEATRFFLDLLQ